MPRPAIAPRPGVRKQIPLKLSPDDAVDLHAFCEAHYGARQNAVIAEAVRRLIKYETERDSDLRDRFLEARERLLSGVSETIGEPLRLISRRGRDETGGQ